MSSEIESSPGRPTVISALGVYASAARWSWWRWDFRRACPDFLYLRHAVSLVARVGPVTRSHRLLQPGHTGLDLQFLWAPFIDRAPVPVLTGWLGHRRSWMLVCQGLIMVGLVALAGSDPASSLGTDRALCVPRRLLIGHSGHCNRRLAHRSGGNIQAGRPRGRLSWGYRVAIIVAGAVPLLLAEAYGWDFAYALMAATMTVGVVAVRACRGRSATPSPDTDRGHSTRPGP